MGAARARATRLRAATALLAFPTIALAVMVIDARGVLRVQYMGVRFEPTELLADIRSVLAENVTR